MGSGELFCALLLASTSLSSEKTPQRNHRYASQLAAAWETPVCAEQRLSDTLGAYQGRDPLDAQLLWVLSVACLHVVKYQCHSGQKRAFLSAPPPQQGNSLREAIGTTQCCHLSVAHAGQQQHLVPFH